MCLKRVEKKKLLGRHNKDISLKSTVSHLGKLAEKANRGVL